MNERELYQPLIRGARTEGWALFRLHDGAAGKHPFDIGGVAPGGKGVALEAKVVRSMGRPSLSLPTDWGAFEAHQTAWLKLYAEAGAIALVSLYFVSTGQMMLRRVLAHPTPGGGLLDGPSIWMSKHEGVWLGYTALVSNLQ